jgi:hypothetical protein
VTTHCFTTNEVPHVVVLVDEHAYDPEDDTSLKSTTACSRLFALVQVPRVATHA